MARPMSILLFGLVAFSCFNCHRSSGPPFVDQNAYIRRPSKSPLCRIIAKRERTYWWGFIDRSGKVVVPPLLSHAEDFSEGYALVTVDLEQIAIGQDGRIVLHQSSGVRSWRQGKRGLPPMNQKHCFIDTAGKVVSRLFEADNGFDCYLADGVAMVQQNHGTFLWYRELYGYIDKAGNWIIRPAYPEAHPFFEGLGRVRPSGVNKGRAGILWAGLLGYVDTTGKMAIPAQFAQAKDFHEGLAAVSKDGRRWGYIDKSGKMVIQPMFSYANDFHEGRAAVSEDGGSEGHIDRVGNWTTSPKYATAYEFAEGLASITTVFEGKWKSGFVNRKGVVIIPPQYDSADSFSDGLAAVGKKVNDTIKYGYINHDGNVVTPLTLDDVNPLVEGMGRIRMDEKYGYVDRTGKIVILPKYEEAEDFFGGLARVYVRHNGELVNASIDTSGRIVWQESFPRK